MSYDIIYNKQFVRLRKTGEVIPMLLAGSSNCYEVGIGGRTGRRTRDWSALRYYNRKGKLSEKPELILKKLDAELNSIIRRHRGEDGTKPADIRDHFGYYASLAVGGGHCGGTSWSKYRSQFTNGINNALTVEELAELGVTLYFHTVSIREESEEGKPADVCIKTERDYFAELKKWKEWRAKAGRGFYLSFRPYDTDTILERLRSRKRKAPREKTSVKQDHYFVLVNSNGALVKYTSRSYRYSPYMSSGKRFRTEKEVEQYQRRLLARGCYMADTWKVERVNLPFTFLV